MQNKCFCGYGKDEDEAVGKPVHEQEIRAAEASGERNRYGRDEDEAVGKTIHEEEIRAAEASGERSRNSKMDTNSEAEASIRKTIGESTSEKVEPDKRKQVTDETSEDKPFKRGRTRGSK
ncbi:hypothetical protein R1flu_021976 [Riccia fluitans]|uniref:Uncharacterized protein n=1 Tax=Riccia fluitans TaxID=41844 RepID=A0ABD1ZQW0_9MARC